MKQSSAVKSRLLRIYIFFLLLLLIQRSEAAVPTAITVPAKRITYTSCILNCLVNPNGASTTISFEYGFTKSYDSTLSISGTISGSATLYKEVQLKNLIPGRTYHFRVKAVNASGTSYGQDFTFNTSKNFGSSHSAAHTVVVNTDGVVFAYGYNVTGQLGDNTTSHKYVPYKVLKGAYNGTTYLGDNTSSPIIAVSAGIFHTIALAADGSVYTFGTNKNGQIGDNTSTDRYTPVRVLKGDYNGTTYLGDNSANPIIAVSAGSYHSLALAADGTVYAFGYNAFGQIGDSSTTDRRVPAKVLMGGYKGNRYLGDNSNNPIVSISAGGTHNMVLSAEGLVYSFGDNTYGQLGDSTNTTRLTPVKVLKGSHPGTRFLGDNKPIYAVAAGGRHSLILSSSGMVYAFGYNYHGQLGDNNTAADKKIPVNVLKGAYSGKTYLGDDTSNKCISLITGYYHSAVQVENGSIFSFGYNTDGACGDNSTTWRTTPVRVLKGAYAGTTYLGDDASNPIISIVAGEGAIIGLAWDGTLYSNGRNAYGPLGDNSSTNRYTPIKTLGVGGSGYLNLINCTLPKANTGSSRNICKGDSTVLGAAAVKGNSYVWKSKPSGFNSTLSNPKVAPTVNTKYILTEMVTLTGCRKTDSLTISINTLPAANIGTSPTICRGDSAKIGATAVTGNTYAWTSKPAGFTSTLSNPKVAPDSTTMYYLTETSTITRCKKTDSVMVNVNQLPKAQTGIGKTICNTDSVTIGAAAVTGNTYIWLSKPPGFYSPKSLVRVAPSVSTKFILTETITATGCKRTDSVTINVNPIPQAIVGSTKTICWGDTVVIGSTSVKGNTYSWSSKPIGFSSTLSNPKVVPGEKIKYYLTETITATGCTKSDSVLVNVNPLPPAKAGVSQVICNGVTVGIGSSFVTGRKYSWTSNPKGFTATIANPTVTPNTSTTYYLTETIVATNCKRTDSVTIAVNPLPNAITGSNRAVCDGDSVYLGSKGVTGNSYQWSSNPKGFFATVANPIIIPTSTTTYYLTETNTITNCKNNDSVRVTVNQLPIANAGVSKTICWGDSVIIGTSATGGNDYHWYNNINSKTFNTDIAMVTPKVTTTYHLVVTDISTKCKNYDSVIVTVNPLPQVDLGNDKAICNGDSVQIGIGARQDEYYFWYSIPEGFTSQVSKPIVKPVVTTHYILIAMLSPSNCSKIDTIKVTVNPLPAKPVIVKTKNELGTGNYSEYQWELNGKVIGGAIGKTYQATDNGDYKVVVKDSNGCKAVSDAFSFIYTGIKNVKTPIVGISPNPNAGSFDLILAENSLNADINISDLVGNVFYTDKVKSSAEKIPVSIKNVVPGMYIIQLVNPDGKAFYYKFIVR